jgi:hypothetical protein
MVPAASSFGHLGGTADACRRTASAVDGRAVYWITTRHGGALMRGAK